MPPIPSIPPFTAIVALGLIAGTVALGWHDPTIGRTVATAAAIAVASALRGVSQRVSPAPPGA